MVKKEFTKNKRLINALTTAVAYILSIAILLCSFFGAASCGVDGAGGTDGAESGEGTGGGDGGGENGKVVIEKPANGIYNEGELKPGDDYEDVSTGSETLYSQTQIARYTYNTDYATYSAVGYYGRVVGEVKRNIPQTTRDEGLGAYPRYGYTLSTVIGTSSAAVAARNALISESSYLTATGTANAGGGGYTWMDEDGYLYSGTVSDPVPALDASGMHRKLYKHSASVGLYLGDVSDDEPAVIKDLTMRNRVHSSSYNVTGLYAPAGELIKIQLSGADMDATGGIIIHIGQALYNGQANNIWTEKNQMQRIPHLLNTMQVTKNTATYDEKTDTWTAYVGSFIGGPIYIRNETATFSVRISGGVQYRHFILGYTTEEEFAQLSKSSAPYFDLEVWNLGVLHSGPATYAAAFDYGKLYQAAILWDKVSSVAITNGTSQGIVFLYDPFVAAGAAVAFPGRSSVNCPLSWMSSSLNYNSIVTSGSWGNFHEYHHNFQNFGIGYTGEVTNNALNIVDYTLFTKISSARSTGTYGAQGLGGWNNYTSATWVQQLMNSGNISSTNGLAVYANLIHNFGQNNFIAARGSTNANYINKWATITHNDFSWFNYAVTKCSGTIYNLEETPAEYPEFVPVSSVYQTGRSYDYYNTVTGQYETEYITTMQPYVIHAGQDFTLDLRPYTTDNGQYQYGSIIIGNAAASATNFKFEIKSVTEGSDFSGTLTETQTAGVYTYSPDPNQALSGEIHVTLSITTEDGATEYNGHPLMDVDLVIELEQSHEANKTILERTTYFYDDETMITDAREAFESDFGDYNKTEYLEEHTNPTQNCNTDIWYYPDTDANHAKYENVPEHFFERDNTISVVSGKLYLQEAGKYRIYLRGRLNCAVYYSFTEDGEYELGAYIADNNTSAAFRLNDPNTYFDVTVSEPAWVYVQEVLIVNHYSNGQSPYIGLGMSQWTVPQYSTETVTDSDGNILEIKYYDSNGHEVTAEQASNTDPIEPTSASYVNAYRNDYEFATNTDFVSDYFYRKTYSYTYTGTNYETVTEQYTGTDSETYPKYISTLTDADTGNEVAVSNFSPAKPIGTQTYVIEHLFDGDKSTASHTLTGVSTANPATLVFDLGKEVTVNTLTLSKYVTSNDVGNRVFPKVLYLYGATSLDGWTAETDNDEEGGCWTLIGKWSALNGNYSDVPLQLFNDFTIRYFKVVVPTTNYTPTTYFGLSELHLSYTTRLTGSGNWVEPDSAKITYSATGWSGVQMHSSFGHVYYGMAGATMEFEFTGTRLGLITPAEYTGSYIVEIDGTAVGCISDLNEITADYGLTYLSDKLENGVHKVKITCTGDTYIDSVVYFTDGLLVVT